MRLVVCARRCVATPAVSYYCRNVTAVIGRRVHKIYSHKCEKKKRESPPYPITAAT